MKHVYVAGPYTAPDAAGVEANVHRALDAADALLDAGLHPYVPHLSHYQHARKQRPYREWMDIDADEVRRCDILLRLDGPSSGADEEVVLARHLGRTIYIGAEGEALLLWAWQKDLSAGGA